MQAAPGDYLALMRRAFERHYAEGSDVWTRDPNARAFPDFVEAHVALGPTDRVLDIGCGAGLDAVRFAARAGAVDGVDLVPHAAWADAAAACPGLKFYAGDVLTFVPAAPYRLIFDSGCFHHQHPAERGRFLAWVRSHLAPGGVFALNTFKNEAQPTRIDAYGRLHAYFTDAELEALLGEAGLTVFAQREQSRAADGDFLRFSLCR